MKGQQQAVSAILITAVMIGVVGTVYFWGLPLIEKNRDVSILEISEGFMINLDNKIKDVANHGGREKVRVTVPGVIYFDGENISLEIDTAGSIYAENAPIPLTKNACAATGGAWGNNDPEVICLLSKCISGSPCKTYQTIYTLRYIKLDTGGIKSYQIILKGNRNYAGEDDYIQIENKGTADHDMGGGYILTKTELEITIL